MKTTIRASELADKYNAMSSEIKKLQDMLKASIEALLFYSKLNGCKVGGFEFTAEYMLEADQYGTRAREALDQIMRITEADDDE